MYLTPPTGQGIPFDIVASICGAIGHLYPNAKMGPGNPDGVCLIIPSGDRQADTFDQNTASATKLAADPDLSDDYGITSWDGQTLSGTVGADYRQQLAAWAYTLLTESGDAFNYVEQQIRTPEGRPFLVTAAWSEQQTPHQLRMKAEQRADTAEQELAALRHTTSRSESPK